MGAKEELEGGRGWLLDWEEEKWDCLKLAQTTKDLGVDGIDFHARFLGQLDDPLKNVKDALSQTGLVLSGLSLSNNFIQPDKEKLDLEITETITKITQYFNINIRSK